MQVLKSLFVLLLAGSTSLVFADEYRRHGAHEHGVGKVQIAQEGTELHIEFESPAANIVGFEHAPKTQEDHQALEKALARLKDGAALFRLPEAAGCRLARAHVSTPLTDHKDGEEELHAKHAHHRDEPSHNETREDSEEKHEHDDSHDHEGETHSDISSAYRFACTHPEKLDQISVRVFEIFPMTERLQVQFITGKRQGAAELSASRPALRL